MKVLKCQGMNLILLTSFKRLHKHLHIFLRLMLTNTLRAVVKDLKKSKELINSIKKLLFNVSICFFQKKCFNTLNS